MDQLDPYHPILRLFCSPLNSVPVKYFKCLRGVRQGDPLSLLLFVIVAELLQLLVNKAASQGLLRAHIPHGDDEFPII